MNGRSSPLLIVGLTVLLWGLATSATNGRFGRCLFAASSASAVDGRPSSTPAPPVGTSPAAAAVALCVQVPTVPPAERVALLERGFKLAEQAVAEDDGNPAAHFAVFCTLGLRLKIEGFSFGGLRAVRRMRQEVDRALALSPDYADALIGKGAMLAEAPRFAGGDLDEGLPLLRRGTALAPSNVDGQLHLGRALLAAGEHDEARAVAARALALAEQKGGGPSVAEARRLVADAAKD